MVERIKSTLGMMYLILILWFLVYSLFPEHRREQVLLGLWHRLEEVSRRAARVTGRLAMAAELKDLGQGYDLPYILSVLGDRARAGYDRTRGAL